MIATSRAFSFEVELLGALALLHRADDRTHDQFDVQEGAAFSCIELMNSIYTHTTTVS